jgi:hypothetical protein
VIANTPIVVALMLINPTTGVPYKAGSADAPSVIPLSDPTVAMACVLIDPTTGAAYRT